MKIFNLVSISVSIILVLSILTFAFADKNEDKAKKQAEADKKLNKSFEWSWVYICAPTYGAGQFMENFYKELNKTSPELVDKAQEDYNNGICN